MTDLSRQYISSLSILAVAIFVGVPIWWKTTEVYRCPLPYKEIGSLRNKNVPPKLAIRISVALLSNSTSSQSKGLETLVTQLTKELVVGSISARNTRILVQYVVQAHEISATDKSKLLPSLSSDNVEDFSSHVSDFLPSSLGHYFILLLPESLKPQQWQDFSAFVSQYRHTILPTKDENDLMPCLGDILKVIKSVYGDRKQLEKSLKNAAGTNLDRVDAESMRQFKASQGYQLSFTLLNPDPSQLEASWNIRDATEKILTPFLEHPGISLLGNFTVNSQEFHYTDTKFKPKKTGKNFHIPLSQLPPMISSVESKLASHVSQFPSLNFLVYVPKRTESPLFIRQEEEEEERSYTDNFLVPQWGGVIICNLGSESGDVEAESPGGRAIRVNVPMEKLMPVFVKQLHMLLGVPETPISKDSGKLLFSPGRHRITDWRVDQLLLAKLIESASMTTTSLVSLVQLLDKVKNMVISDHIQREVEYSLHSIQQCYSKASSGHLRDAYDFSKQAMKSAEIAFFDPSILELLYFPDDQKFAIYIPLFLPISVPILFSSMAALKWAGAHLKGKGEKKKA